VLPLSAWRTYRQLSPSAATWRRKNRDCAPNGAPVRRWHAMQWHIEIRTGSPVHVMRKAPQQQAATREAGLRICPGGLPMSKHDDTGFQQQIEDHSE